MKRVLLVLMLVLSIQSIGQNISESDSPKVQSKFFGCDFNTDGNNITKYFSNKGKYYSVENNGKGISVHDVYFGGHEFKFVDFYCTNSLLFYSIYFSSNFKDKEGAMELYNNIRNQLEEKYPLKNLTSDAPKDKYFVFYYDDVNAVTLDMEYSTSNGGEKYYYVRLAYYNEKLRAIRESEESNEL